MAKISIYTTPYCHYCKLAKEYFKSKGLTWDEFDVMANPAKANEMIEKTGQMGVPVILIDDKVVVGFNRPLIDQYLGK